MDYLTPEQRRQQSDWLAALANSGMEKKKIKVIKSLDWLKEGDVYVLAPNGLDYIHEEGLGILSYGIVDALLEDNIIVRIK